MEPHAPGPSTADSGRIAGVASVSLWSTTELARRYANTAGKPTRLERHLGIVGWSNMRWALTDRGEEVQGIGMGITQQLARFALAGGLALALAAVHTSAPVADADPMPPPEPSPTEPAPAQVDPPPPASSWDIGGLIWSRTFPKCWPPWQPPGTEPPPPGEPRLTINSPFTVPYSPCPAPPPYPTCGTGGIFVCFPGQVVGGPLPPGYYGPPSWYNN